MANRSIEFFDHQFQQQVREGQFALNPFEELALPHLRGRVLDLGCGLGNLSIAAARQGCSVLALDGSDSAIDRIRQAAKAEALAIEAVQADLGGYRITQEFDAIVAIGLLMFFEQSVARAMLEDIRSHVRPGGHAIVNCLVVGTTYLDMFEPGRHHLFAADELRAAFSGWTILADQQSTFEAPGNTRKVFSTLIARR